MGTKKLIVELRSLEQDRRHSDIYAETPPKYFSPATKGDWQCGLAYGIMDFFQMMTTD